MELDTILALFAALEREQVEYKVIGGVAMNVVGLARATEDLDIFVEPSPENVARLRAALEHVFHDPEISLISSEDLAGEYPAIQYVPPSGDLHIDILSRLGEAFTFAEVEAQTQEISGIKVPVATPRMLYRMKKGTVRPKDRADADWLRRTYKVED